MIRRTVLTRADIDAATTESEARLLGSERQEATTPHWTASDPCEGTDPPFRDLPVVPYWPLRTRRDEREVAMVAFLAVSLALIVWLGWLR